MSIIETTALVTSSSAHSRPPSAKSAQADTEQLRESLKRVIERHDFGSIGEKALFDSLDTESPLSGIVYNFQKNELKRFQQPVRIALLALAAAYQATDYNIPKYVTPTIITLVRHTILAEQELIDRLSKFVQNVKEPKCAKDIVEQLAAAIYSPNDCVRINAVLRATTKGVREDAFRSLTRPEKESLAAYLGYLQVKCNPEGAAAAVIAKNQGEDAPNTVASILGKAAQEENSFLYLIKLVTCDVSTWHAEVGGAVSRGDSTDEEASCAATAPKS